MFSLKNSFNELNPFFKQVDQIKKEYILDLKKESSEFNIFKLLKMQHKEVETHNRLIGELLDPDGTHKMGDIFQKIFLEIVLPQQIDHTWQVEIEERFDQCKFDISLQCEKKRIVIESKIDSYEGFQQLKRYHDTLKENKDIDEFYILFLTIDGYVPKSIPHTLSSKVISISYIKDIANWILKCVHHVAEGNLKEILLQYHDLLINMGNQALKKGFMNKISDYCLKNDFVDLALDIAESAKEIKIEIQKRFWVELTKSLKSEGLNVIGDSEFFYNGDKISRYYLNQKNNKHFGIPILLQKFDSGEEVILLIQVDEELYYSVLISKRGRYLTYDKYKSKIPFEKKLNTFTHNWESSDNPSWSWKYPSCFPTPLNFKTFDQPEIRELADPKKLKVLTQKLADEISELVKRFKRTRN